MVPVVPLPMVSMPPVPGAMVYLLALSKWASRICLLPSSETVRGAVILPRKLAMPVLALGIPPDQLPAALQLPSASTFHWGVPERLRTTGAPTLRTPLRPVLVPVDSNQSAVDSAIAPAEPRRKEKLTLVDWPLLAEAEEVKE